MEHDGDIPETGQGLGGEKMGGPHSLVPETSTGPGGAPTGDEGEPNTPEQNLPSLEYEGGPPLPERGPFARNPQPATTASPLESLPESMSVAETAAWGEAHFKSGGH